METARCASPGLLGAPLLTCASSCDASNAWPLGPAAFFREVRKKRKMTYGPIWSHMVPEVMRNGPGYTSTKESWSHQWWEMVPTCIWMSIPNHWFIDPVDRSRSISTVDKDSPTGDYGRYRRSIRIHLQRITVDCGWWIKIRDNFVVDFIDDTCADFRTSVIYLAGRVRLCPRTMLLRRSTSIA